MPELPEVEIMARNLDRWLSGDRIATVEILDEKLRGRGVESLVGARVERAWRRAKYAIVDLDSGHCIVLHYRMTGKTVLDPENVRRARLRLQMEAGSPVAFEDPRRFGEVWCVSAGDLEEFFRAKRIGPEPWPEERDGQWWAASLEGLRGPIKSAMMRQDRVAGIGNILASEALFLARIDPRARVGVLESDDWDALARATHTVIERTLSAEGGDEIAYVNQGGEGSFLVYGHAGEPCPRCGSPIERVVQAGRGTFYCSSCVGEAR